MAKKNVGIFTALAIGTAAAVVAGGVLSYFKRNEIKRFTETVMKKMRPTDDEDVYTADIDDDGTPDIILADTTGDGQIDSILMDTDGDGTADAAALDLDADGEPDIIITDMEPENGGEDKENGAE